MAVRISHFLEELHESEHPADRFSCSPTCESRPRRARFFCLSCSRLFVAMASTRRSRSGSLSNYLADIEENPAGHHLLHLGAFEAQTDAGTTLEPVPSAPYAAQSARPRINRPNTPPGPARKAVEPQRGPKWLQWLTNPLDSFTVLATIFSLWAAWRIFLPSYRDTNPFSAFLFVSYPVAWGDKGLETRFRKGPRDLLFLGYWIVVFSFVRTTLMQGPLKTLGRKFGIRRRRKLERFEEQVSLRKAPKPSKLPTFAFP